MTNDRKQANPPPIKSGNDLDWAGAEEAAQALLKHCQAAQYYAPDDVAMHIVRLHKVCEAMNAISDKLKLKGSPP